jgi:2-polyprenyl-6-methoxyphenol hydroxylase-like FAD-dependent oxidoreductase
LAHPGGLVCIESRDTGSGEEDVVRRSVGIVGSGVAALHLGLMLRRHGVEVTLYTDKHPDSLARGRLLNTVVHHAPTIARERELGIDFWPAEQMALWEMSYDVAVQHPVRFVGSFGPASSAIDYRVYLPRLVESFEERGGVSRLQILRVADIEAVSECHDLTVVASGRSPLAQAFRLRADKCPYARPPRALSVGLYRGVTPEAPGRVSINFVPGHGELIEIPLLSFDGTATALLFEVCPGSPLFELVNVTYGGDPALFHRVVLGALRAHFPRTYERVDTARFVLTRPLDYLQGVLTPTVREDWVRLPNGRIAISLGDAHAAIDPVMGQGANVASYAAWQLGEAIVADSVYDEVFACAVAARRAEFVEAASDWTNLMLRQPWPEHLVSLLRDMPYSRPLADEFTSNFAAPDRQWRSLATPARARAFAAAHLDSLAVAR